jgi:hypothetical protein
VSRQCRHQNADSDDRNKSPHAEPLVALDIQRRDSRRVANDAVPLPRRTTGRRPSRPGNRKA